MITDEEFAEELVRRLNDLIRGPQGDELAYVLMSFCRTKLVPVSKALTQHPSVLVRYVDIEKADKTVESTYWVGLLGLLNGLIGPSDAGKWLTGIFRKDGEAITMHTFEFSVPDKASIVGLEGSPYFVPYEEVKEVTRTTVRMEIPDDKWILSKPSDERVYDTQDG